MGRSIQPTPCSKEQCDCGGHWHGRDAVETYRDEFVRGYETMNMIRRRQIKGADKGKIKAQNQFISGLFVLIA